MPSVSDNYKEWNDKQNWSDLGEKWSRPWGSSEAQWKATVFPRIQQFLPVQCILEIAPGYGRWTQYLSASCDRLTAVDLSPKCIDFCNDRFARLEHVRCLVNDGYSLAAIEPRSVDFAFSFDSLVHADLSVIEAYLTQLSDKLKVGGIGFIHHSNLGSYASQLQEAPSPKEMWRSREVSAKNFRDLCKSAGLHCFRQEMLNWSNAAVLIDCLSSFRAGPDYDVGETEVFDNWQFMEEAQRARFT